MITDSHNADYIKRRYGAPLLAHVFGMSAMDYIKDLPGYTYTGELREPQDGEWVLDFLGHPRQVGKLGNACLMLIMRRVLPLSVSYHLLAWEDMEDGDVIFVRDQDSGRMMPYDPAFGTRPEVYLMEEQW